MFANKSAAYPEGFLDQSTLKSFYAMTGTDDSNLEYTPGAERIPENWYTRAVGDPYDIPLLLQDISTLIEEHPELSAFGGNTGTVNSFTGLDIQNLTVSILISCSVTLDKSDLLQHCLPTSTSNLRDDI